MNISQYIQIIAVVIVFAIYIYGLFKVIKITRGSSPNKGNIVIGFTAATLLLIYLILSTYIIGPADFALIMLTFGLVLATTLYAISAAKQAAASVKMAEEMRDTRYASFRPIIEITWIGPDDNEKRISFVIKNVGLGPALNLKCYFSHDSRDKFKFTKTDDVNILIEKGCKTTIRLPYEQFDLQSWTGFAINCEYQSIYKESFHSVLKFDNQEKKYLEV